MLGLLSSSNGPGQSFDALFPPLMQLDLLYRRFQPIQQIKRMRLNAAIGAILLTGNMGGTICTHWRVGDPFIVQTIIPIVVWMAVSLREPRLWSLIPWRQLRS